MAIIQEPKKMLIELELSGSTDLSIEEITSFIISLVDETGLHLIDIRIRPNTKRI